MKLIGISNDIPKPLPLTINNNMQRFTFHKRKGKNFTMM